ncbi:MAG: hypothetical protein WEC84_02995 [Candidatus Andersenbacteria bacterium]
MTVRVFLLSTTASMIAGWAVWLLIINWIDPLRAGAMGFILFFLSLFVAVASTVALAGYGVRRLLQPAQFAAYRVRPSVRQGIWLGIFLNLLLFLQLHQLLRWWIALIIIFVFIFLELLFLSYDRGTRHNTTHREGRKSAA